MLLVRLPILLYRVLPNVMRAHIILYENNNNNILGIYFIIFQTRVGGTHTPDIG